MTDRPEYCCGVCPGIEGGGYDCTCRGNPRCPNYQGFENRVLEWLDTGIPERDGKEDD